MDVLRQWLADVGIQAHSSSSLEQVTQRGAITRMLPLLLKYKYQHPLCLCLLPAQDFASGYLFAKLLAAHALQPDLAAFQNKGKPDAYLNNYMRLQVSLTLWHTTCCWRCTL
jgi:hypothetical protein